VNTNVPASLLTWVEVFGTGNAAAFDRYGWQYFTRDVFDGHYVGYFDASPLVAGATGMTYETDGGKALQRRRDDNTVITFREGIAHHYVASLATLETAAANRGARLRDFHAFYRTGIADGRAARMKRIVVLPDQDPTNAARLVSLLAGHGVEVERLTEPYTAPEAHTYMGPAAAVRKTFPAGALVVHLDQPQNRMARALLEPDAEVTEPFKSRQLERFARNQRRGSAPGEGYEFYDITAWSLPFTLGLEAWWTEDLGAAGRAHRDTAERSPHCGRHRSVSDRARSAYVFPNDRQGGALASAAGRGLSSTRAAIRCEPTAAHRGHVRGTCAQSATPTTASRLGRRRRFLTAVQPAFPDSGAVGWVPRGGPCTGARAGCGDGVSRLVRGTRHFRTGAGAGLRAGPADRIGRVTLDDYNVLIVPEGSPATIERQLGAA
jgi:hypothetical protein